jgi:hypothetical protein
MRAAAKRRVDRLHFALGCAGVLAAALLLFSQAGNAAEARHAKADRKVPMTNLCLNVDSNPACEAAFAAALRSIDTEADVVVRAPRGSDARGPHGIQPLRFQKRAPWVRRLETLGKEGIPFVRMPRGPESELIVGINRKGMLGFELKQVSNR